MTSPLVMEMLRACTELMQILKKEDLGVDWHISVRFGEGGSVTWCVDMIHPVTREKLRSIDPFEEGVIEKARVLARTHERFSCEERITHKEAHALTRLDLAPTGEHWLRIKNGWLEVFDDTELLWSEREHNGEECE